MIAADWKWLGAGGCVAVVAAAWWLSVDAPAPAPGVVLTAATPAPASARAPAANSRLSEPGTHAAAGTAWPPMLPLAEAPAAADAAAASAPAAETDAMNDAVVSGAPRVPAALQDAEQDARQGDAIAILMPGRPVAEDHSPDLPDDPAAMAARPPVAERSDTLPGG